MKGSKLSYFIIPLILSLTACKNTARQSQDSSLSGLDYGLRANQAVGDTIPTPTPDPFAGGNPTPTPVPGTGTRTGPVPTRYTLRGVGYDQTITLTIRTRDILKVKFVPETQDRTPAGFAFSPNYS